MSHICVFEFQFEKHQSKNSAWPESLLPHVPTMDPNMRLQITDTRARLQMQVVGQLEAQLGKERQKLDLIMAGIASARVLEERNNALKAPKAHHIANPMKSERNGDMDLVGEINPMTIDLNDSI